MLHTIPKIFKSWKPCSLSPFEYAMKPSITCINMQQGSIVTHKSPMIICTFKDLQCASNFCSLLLDGILLSDGPLNWFGDVNW
jgi:hypothetical protein